MPPHPNRPSPTTDFQPSSPRSRSASGAPAPSFSIRLAATAKAITAKNPPSVLGSVNVLTPRGLDCKRPGADGRPRHLVDRVDPDVLETRLHHQLRDLLAGPIMRDPRQHLVEHDRPQMGKAEARQQFAVFVGS